MTVAHKNLTGTDLHEPKGVAAAAADKVYVSDGAGSGTWQKVTSSQIDSTVNPFGAQLFHIQDQKTSGTGGGTFTTGAWRTRDLNTSLTNEITSASLTSNQISLPAGTYYVQAWATANNCNAHQLRLQNVTDATTLLTGLSAYTGGSFVVPGAIGGRFTLAGTKTIELQHQSAFTGNFGLACSFGTEVYADIKIWKVG